jgi:hypothetical protein
MPMQFSLDDGQKMRELEAALEVVLKRANDQHLEAAVAAFALLRCARRLLMNYPDPTRIVLVDQVVVPFLQGEPAEGDNAFASGMLIS